MGLERVQAILHRVMDGLTLEQLLYQPKEGCNSIAWLAWHLTRVQDHHLSDLAEIPQAWVSEGWHVVFDMTPDPTNTGSGHTPEQVAAFRPPDGAALLGYHDAVYKRSKGLPGHAVPDRPGHGDQRAPVSSLCPRLASDWSASSATTRSMPARRPICAACSRARGSCGAEAPHMLLTPTQGPQYTSADPAYPVG